MTNERLRVALVAVLGISLGGLVGIAPAFSQSQRGAADVHCRPRGCVDQRDLARGSVSTSKIDPGAVTTEKLGEGSVTSGKIEDGTIQIADLAFDPLTQTALDGALSHLSTSDGNEPNSGSNQVHWDNLAGVPTDFADGSDEAGSSAPAGPASDLVCTGCVGATDLDGDSVTSGKVVDNSLSGDDLGTDSVGSNEVDDNTLTADDLGVGSVAAVELADDSVDTEALQDRAVRTDKMQANFSTTLPAARTLSTGTNDVFGFPVPVTVPGSADDHAVLITGQVQLTCSTCAGGEAATISWQLERDGVLIGPAYSETLHVNDPSVVASISYVDVVAGGTTYGYDLVATVSSVTSETVDASGALLHLIDIGAF